MKHYSGRPLRCIEQFLNQFQPLFSKTQMHGLRQLVQAMFFDYKRLSLSAASKRADCDYQRLQYFFSESAWDIDALNTMRIKIIQNQKTTRATIKGVMAIDDIWVGLDGQLFIVDYKSTSKEEEVSIDADWQISYKRQMEIYQWLFRRNGFNVSST